MEKKVLRRRGIEKNSSAADLPVFLGKRSKNL